MSYMIPPPSTEPDTGPDLKEYFQHLDEDELISVYTPEAEFCTRDEALKLANERDAEAAENLLETALDIKDQQKTQLNLERAARTAKIMSDLGY